MHDENADSGFGGLAWYQLGRWHAEDDADLNASLDRMSRRRSAQPNIRDLLAQNQALAAENARLRQELEDYRYNYENLRRWADQASQDLKRLRGEDS